MKRLEGWAASDTLKDTGARSPPDAPEAVATQGSSTGVSRTPCRTPLAAPKEWQIGGPAGDEEQVKAPSRSTIWIGGLPLSSPRHDRRPLPREIRAALPTGRLLDPHKVARALNVSRRHVYDLEHSGRLPGVRVGRLLRFHPQTVANFIDRDADV